MHFCRRDRLGKPSIIILRSGIFVSTGRRLRRWCADASESISNTFGMTLPRTRIVRYRKMTVLLTSQLLAPGRMRAAGPISFPSHQQPKISKSCLKQNDNTGPGIGGEKRMAKFGSAAHAVASDAKVVVLKNTGHWILEENPKETTDALMNFL